MGARHGTPPAQPLPWRDVRHVLFDLDGTLIDSAADLGRTANQMRAARGLDALPLSAYRAWAGAGARGMMRVAFDLLPGAPQYAARRQEFLDRYTDQMYTATRPFEGVPALIEELNRRRLPWGIVTNKFERFTHPLAAALPVFGGAAAVVCSDTVGRMKPHPAALVEAMRRMDADPARCIYVGDDERDMQAGRAAGMRTVAACYGYLNPETDVHRWHCDARIDAPLQLLQMLGYGPAAGSGGSDRFSPVAAAGRIASPVGSPPPPE